jgi:hypothetical protein
MKVRRGLALVTAVVASATVVAGETAAAGMPARGASRPTICVALVVDARSIGSDVSTSCAKLPKGASGVAVLQAGGHQVGFRSDGLLCTIDGLPKTGCAGINDSHYWAYFHRAPGSTRWVYSSEGPASYQPVNDSTEGWVYDDGKALTPENVAYHRICPPERSATATPSETASAPAESPSATATAQPTTATQHPASTRAGAGSALPTATPSPGATDRHRAGHRPSVAAADTGPATTDLPSAATSPLPSAVALTGGTDTSSSHSGRLGLVVGLLVVVALGVAAFLRSRRSPR